MYDESMLTSQMRRETVRGIEGVGLQEVFGDCEDEAPSAAQPSYRVGVPAGAAPGARQYALNEAFQRWFDPGGDGLDEAVDAMAQLHASALLHAPVIIHELSLPQHHRTLKHAGVGGRAGGAKVVVDGIFFKVGTDEAARLYCGPDAAAKAASHELRGSSVVHLSGLPCPPQCGSGDGGRTVAPASDAGLADAVRRLASKLGQQPHIAGVRAETAAECALAVDVEGRRGLDQRPYLLDLHRLCVPEHPAAAAECCERGGGERAGDDGRRGVLHRLMRVDAPALAGVGPLCADALTEFVRHDPRRKEARAASAGRGVCLRR